MSKSFTIQLPKNKHNRSQLARELAETGDGRPQFFKDKREKRRQDAGKERQRMEEWDNFQEED